MDPMMMLIVFLVGSVIGFVLTRNFFISLGFGVIAILIALGAITVGFNLGAVLPW